MKIQTGPFALALTFAISFSLANASTDVGTSHQNFKAINFLEETKIISGYPDGTFKPDKVINRAELIKILVESNSTSPDPTLFHSCFPDVKQEWFAPYVCYAKTQGWISGYPDGTYKPEKTVNRVEALKIIYSSRGLDNSSTSSSSFSDIPKTAWYAKYVSSGKERNIIPTSKSTYSPSASITRSEVAEMLFRVITLQKQAQLSFVEPSPSTYEALIDSLSSSGKNSHIVTISQPRIPNTTPPSSTISKPTTTSPKSTDYTAVITRYNNASSSYTKAQEKVTDIQSVMPDLLQDTTKLDDTTLRRQAANIYALMNTFVSDYNTLGQLLSQTSAQINPRSKSEWISPAAWRTVMPLRIGHAWASFGPQVKKVIRPRFS